jgi:molybdopterin-containing oxidoreductase family membrane subunit
LFSKFFPVIAIAEIKHILKKSGENYKVKMDVVENEKVDEFAHAHAH